MLKVITLETIDKIFESVNHTKLSAESKMVYINCLIHHFKGLEPTKENTHAFRMYFSEFKGKYQKFEQNMIELHRAGLISIENTFITFNNYWGPYIDQSKLDAPKQEKKQITLQDYWDEIKSTDTYIDYLAMRYKFSKKHILHLVEHFFKEQINIGAHYQNISYLKKHLINWINKNKDIIAKVNTIKSDGKLI